jgi:hypothetical protein
MIYFIQETGWFRNRVKIGTTNNIKKRIRDFRTSSPSKLKVVLVLVGNENIEAIYHERFAQYNLHGEWFKFGLRLRLFVWLNSYKSEMFDKVNQITLDEEGYGHKVNETALNEEDSGYEMSECDLQTVKRYEAYLDELDDKFVWRKVTQVSFDNPNAYGPHYTKKLKLLLDTVGIDYPEESGSYSAR